MVGADGFASAVVASGGASAMIVSTNLVSATGAIGAEAAFSGRAGALLSSDNDEAVLRVGTTFSVFCVGVAEAAFFMEL